MSNIINFQEYKDKKAKEEKRELYKKFLNGEPSFLSETTSLDTCEDIVREYLDSLFPNNK